MRAHWPGKGAYHSLENNNKYVLFLKCLTSNVILGSLGTEHVCSNNPVDLVLEDFHMWYAIN